MNRKNIILIMIVCTIFLSTCTANSCQKRSCILDPEVTEGPYYVDLDDLREDIREDKDGIPLYLTLNVIDYNTCETVENAGVEIWHCAADGIYSHFEEASEGVSNPQTDNTTYLRGTQLSDSNGDASFLTIYPGWYEGRALHIHLKVHINGTEGYVLHTGQLFFSDDLNDIIGTYSPYSSRTITRMLNTEDNIYNNGGSYGLVEDISYVNSDDITEGVIASITLGVDLSLAADYTTDLSTYYSSYSTYTTDLSTYYSTYSSLYSTYSSLYSTFSSYYYSTYSSLYTTYSSYSSSSNSSNGSSSSDAISIHSIGKVFTLLFFVLTLSC